MISRIEAWAGRAAIVAIFTFFALTALYRIQGMLSEPWSYETWLLDLVARICSFMFLILVVATTLVRLPAKSTAAGWEPRFSALAGTFATLVLIVLPRGDLGIEAKFLAATLIIIGTALSIYCLYWLGRSFSIMAHARRLVIAGPYSVVRHPLYASEIITLAGITIANFSLPTLIVALVTIAFQFRRMQNEERVLRGTFPEYAAYAQQVPMFIPRLDRARPAGTPLGG